MGYLAVRRVLFAVWVVMQAALCGGCGPAVPDPSRFTSPPTTDSTGGFWSVSVFDEVALEGDNGVKKVLTSPEGYDIPADKIESVDCPADMEAKAGIEFDCTVKIEGKDQTVHIKVLDDEGQYEVSPPSGS